MTPGFPVIPCREEQVHKGRAAEAEGSEQLKGTKGTCTLRLNLSGALAFLQGHSWPQATVQTGVQGHKYPDHILFPISGHKEEARGHPWGHQQAALQGSEQSGEGKRLPHYPRAWHF